MIWWGHMRLDEIKSRPHSKNQNWFSMHLFFMEIRDFVMFMEFPINDKLSGNVLYLVFDKVRLSVESSVADSVKSYGIW